MSKSLRASALFTLSLLLAGCGSFSPRGGQDLIRPHNLHGTDRRSDAFANDKTPITFTNQGGKTESLSALTDELLSLEYDIRKKDTGTGQATDPGKKISEYTRLAIHLSNQACAAWFDDLYTWDVMLEYRQNNTNIAGDLLLGVMGLVQSGQAAMSAVAMSLGATNNTYENFRSSFLLPKDTLHKVQLLVIRHRKEQEDKILTTSYQESDFYLLRDALLDYHRTCHGQTVANVLDKSLDMVTYEFAFSQVSDGEYFQALHKSNELFRIATGEKEGNFDRDELVDLMVLLENPTIDLGKKSDDPLILARKKVTSLPAKEQVSFKKKLLNAIQNYGASDRLEKRRQDAKIATPPAPTPPAPTPPAPTPPAPTPPAPTPPAPNPN